MEDSENKAVLMLAPFSKVSTLHLPAGDYEKLRTDLSTYIYYSGRLREGRKELYEADRRGTLKDRQAITLSVEVDKWKRASDRMRLSVCGQLRALIDRHLDATKSNPNDELQTDNSSDVILKCTELWHSITITAVKEEIFEKERLLSNVRLHGKSRVYVIMRSRWRVRPRSCMSENSKQQLESKQGDDLADVLIKFHDTIGDTMHMVRSERAAGCPRDVMAEKMETSRHLITCLRLIAKATTEEEPNQEEQSLSVSYLLAEEYKARYTHLQAQNRCLQEDNDMSSGLVAFLFIVAVYLYFR